MPNEIELFEVAFKLRKTLVPNGDSAAFRTLGLDDLSLEHWRNSNQVLISLPHASANVFHPRTRVAWAASQIQIQNPKIHHIRVVLTHTNLSDLGWRPYGWWYLDKRSNVRDVRFVSRNKKTKHVVARFFPPPLIELHDPFDVEEKAAELSSHGRNLAVSLMLINAYTERAAGMAPSNLVSYIPLEWLVELLKRKAKRTGLEASEWSRSVLENAIGRRMSDTGEMILCKGRYAEVFDNSHNLSLLSLIPNVTVLGGEKMSGYLWEIQRAKESHSGHQRLFKTSFVEIPEKDISIIRATERVESQLENIGIRCSQAISVAEHGEFARNSDPFKSWDLWCNSEKQKY